MGRTNWMLDDGTNLRAVKTKARETKTFPRHWVASCFGVTPEGDGWLERTMKLLKKAHGDGFHTAVHLGKRASPNLDGWEAGPPDGCADTCHFLAQGPGPWACARVLCGPGLRLLTLLHYLGYCIRVLTIPFLPFRPPLVLAS